MRGLLEDALAGQGRLLLLSGDPGIGKTRAAEQLSTYAGVRGARVYWGRCHESEGQPPYWPWSEALRAYVREADPVGLRWELGSRAADVARIVPELAERLGDLGEPQEIESEQARFRLFDSFATFLAGASRARPMVLVLDDLHWADEPSLLLLRFVARRLADTGLLIVGTYRDVELGRHHPLADTLGELAGIDGVRRIGLRGLEPEGIADYIELTAGVDRPPADLAAAIHDQTAGNPFFIGEVVRLLAAEGRLGEQEGRREVAIPHGVREVVGRRLDRLSERANEVLKIAAVCGRDFYLAVLEQVCQVDPSEVEPALAEAVGDRLVDEPEETSGMYSFSHALVRETLQAEIPASRRLALQLEIGRGARAASTPASSSATSASSPITSSRRRQLGEVDRAVDYATRAAASGPRTPRPRGRRRALRAGARGARARAEADDRRRLDLLLELGEAQTQGGARRRRARHARAGRRACARARDCPSELARAALAICLLAVAGVVDEPLIALLEESLDAVGPGDSGLRSQLLSALAQELYWVDAAGRSNELGLEALEMARRVGDPGALASALASAPVHGDDPARAGSATPRRERRAARPGQAARRPRARAAGCTSTGCPAGSSSATSRASTPTSPRSTASQAQLRQPSCLWHVPLLRATRALIDGRFDDAERALARRRSRRRVRAEEPVAAQFHATQIALLRRLRRSPEDEAELEALIGQLVELAERYPAHSRLALRRWPLPTPSSAIGARRARCSRRSPPTTSRTCRSTRQWAISLDACSPRRLRFLGDVERAERLYELLAPFDGLNVIAGRAAACYGPVARILGAARAHRPGRAR